MAKSHPTTATTGGEQPPAPPPVVEKPDADVFVPPAERVRDTFWIAAPLSVGGTARLLRLLTRILKEAADASGRLRNILFQGTALSLLEVLSEDNLTELLSIVVDRTPAEVTENYRLVPAILALTDFWMHEDINYLLGEAQRLIPTKPPIPTPPSVG